VPVTLGLTRLLASERLAGRRVGVICNQASVDEAFVHVADRLRGARGVTVGAIFSPQHGIGATEQDNMIETPHGRDRARAVPVYSLYSETREPTPEMLEGLDTLVVDLQDVGTRVYTFIYTMANALRAARRHQVPVIVCDRPNPIGSAVEGPVLQPGYESFVGQFGIPLRHGLTIGELAHVFNEHFGIGAELEVVPMEGWLSHSYHDGTELPWVMPSPNIPTLDTAIVYPGSVLFEGTTLSEGRGTTRPFELLGAPGADPCALVDALRDVGLAGVHFRPASFVPTFQKHAGVLCGGCQIHVTDRARFRPVKTAVTLLRAFAETAAGQFGWRPPPYEYEFEKLPIDILSGSGRLRTGIDAGIPPGTIVDGWEEETEAFRRASRAAWLYPRTSDTP